MGRQAHVMKPTCPHVSNLTCGHVEPGGERMWWFAGRCLTFKRRVDVIVEQRLELAWVQ